MKYFENKIVIGLIVCLFYSCEYDKITSYQTLLKEAKNTMDCGLIELNDDNLFLNKTDNIASYDFNGNQIKVLSTVGRKEYEAIAVKDSLIILSGGAKSFVYKITYDNQLKLLKQKNLFWMVNKFELFDSLLVAMQDGLYFYPPYNDPAKGIFFYKYDSKNDSISGLNNLGGGGYMTTSYTLMHDSLLMFRYYYLCTVNLKDTSLDAKGYQSWIGPESPIESLESKGNYIFSTNSKSIIFYEYINNVPIERYKIL